MTLWPAPALHPNDPETSGRIATGSINKSRSGHSGSYHTSRELSDLTMSVSVRLKQFQLPKCKGEKIAKIEFRGEFNYFFCIHFSIYNVKLFIYIYLRWLINMAKKSNKYKPIFEIILPRTGICTYILMWVSLF